MVIKKKITVVVRKMRGGRKSEFRRKTNCKSRRYMAILRRIRHTSGNVWTGHRKGAPVMG